MDWHEIWYSIFLSSGTVIKKDCSRYLEQGCTRYCKCWSVCPQFGQDDQQESQQCTPVDSNKMYFSKKKSISIWVYAIFCVLSPRYLAIRQHFLMGNLSVYIDLCSLLQSKIRFFLLVKSGGFGDSNITSSISFTQPIPTGKAYTFVFF